MIRTTTLSIQQNRNTPRIWIEGDYLNKAGFSQGCTIKVTWNQNKFSIKLDEAGERKVCGKRYPIIDINNKKIKKVFKLASQVRVLIDYGKILVTRSKKDIRKSLVKNDKSFASVFGGIGTLDEAIKQAGYKPKWAIESNQKYADIWQKNHPGTMHCSDIADVDYDELEQVELLAGGIPCEPFSQARLYKKDLSECIDLSMFFLMIVEKINPKTIILEEVPLYLKSQVGIATLHALERMGYHVQHRIISGKDYGEIEIRKRLVVIASKDNFDFPKISHEEHDLQKILLPANHPDCKWFNKKTKPWIFKSWEKQKEKGYNFQKNQIITKDTKHIQAITKRYFAIQQQNPLVAHPTKKGHFRLLTLDEVRQIKGLPKNYDLGDYITFAGEGMGQGILVNIFRKIVQGLMK